MGRTPVGSLAIPAPLILVLPSLVLPTRAWTRPIGLVTT